MGWIPDPGIGVPKKTSARVEIPREINNEVIQLFSEGKERVGVQCKSIPGLKDKGL